MSTTVLVTAIKIAGTSYGITSGAAYTHTSKWRTTSIMDGATQATGDDPDEWTMVYINTTSVGMSATGVVKFGTACIKTITFQFRTDRDNSSDVITITIAINGINAYTLTLDSTDTDSLTGPHPPDSAEVDPNHPLSADRLHSVTIDLASFDFISRPCGNIFTLTVTQTSYSTGTTGDVSTYCKIIDVT